MDFRRRVAQAIMDAFPQIYSSTSVLMGANAHDGLLSNAFKYSKKKYLEHHIPQQQQQQHSETEMDATINELLELSIIADTDGDGNHVQQGEMDSEYFHILTNATAANDSAVINALKCTFAVRRESILKSERNFIFNVFFEHPMYLNVDFKLLCEAKEADDQKFLQKKNSIFSSINNIFTSQFHTRKQFINQIHPDLQPYAKIITFLYNTTDKVIHSKLAQFTKTVSENLSIADLHRLQDNHSQPLIIIRESDPKEYLISFDGKFVPLMNGFDDAFDMLLKIFLLFNIEYPKEVTKMFVALEALTFKIDRVSKKTSKVLDLIGKVNVALERESDHDSNDSD